MNCNESKLENSSSSRQVFVDDKACSPAAKKGSVAFMKLNSSKVTPQKYINPFKIGLDGLRTSHLSPNVFTTKPNSVNQEEKAFRWSIDQLADLKPVDIDESSHQDIHGDESESEELVQTAIDEFFSKNQIAASPWPPSSKVDSLIPKSQHQVTFSPNLASTAYYDKYEDLLDSSGKSKPCSSMQDACTQTVLTIPLSLDLETILSQYYTFTENQQKSLRSNVDFTISEDSKDAISNSSLRRKLFDYIDDGNYKKDERFMYNPDNLVCQKSPPVSPVTVRSTPQKDKVNTPGSSSPITPAYERKLSGEFSTANMLSPAMSPIIKPAFKTPSASTLLTGNHFRVPTTPNKSAHTPKRKGILSFQNVFKKSFSDFGNVSGIDVADDDGVSNSTSVNMFTSFCDNESNRSMVNQFEHLSSDNQRTLFSCNCIDICSTRIHSNCTEDLMEYSDQNFIFPDHDTGYQSNMQTTSVNDNASLSRLNFKIRSKVINRESTIELTPNVADECFKTPPRNGNE